VFCRTAYFFFGIVIFSANFKAINTRYPYHIILPQTNQKSKREFTKKESKSTQARFSHISQKREAVQSPHSPYRHIAQKQ
jgi:hypothetical protein